jgi:phenylalanyl-tRNA synthetase beta chain
MNIKITYNWLKEYLETDADPYEIGKYLSLSGPSIEHIIPVDDDFVFDIEITSNRIDMASVFGIAQEAQAILPQFGKKAKLKFNPLGKYTFDNLKAEPVPEKKLDIKIDHNLCQRFTAIIFSNVDIKPSPEIIKKRLQMVDIKSINNVIDISNYLMVSLGQPTHMFDYDQISGGKMILRESKKGEKLQTLDEKEITLPGGDIVIEDGSGKLIDLCGIMGGHNSSITNDTKNVVFFVQTYNKRKIRRTSMITGQRTMAATYFEKGLDPNRVEPTLVYGVDLLNEFTNGIVKSELYDIYSSKTSEKDVKVYFNDIQQVMGVPIEEEKIIDILHRLGFKVKRHEDEELAYPDSVYFKVTVPTYRVDDVHIKEDIIEEVARVYGYYSFPNNISPMVYIEQPKDIEHLFSVQKIIKTYLRDIELHEVMNYSMISGELIDKLGMDRKLHLKLANTISTEIEYMRISLIPSLIENMKNNYGKREVLKFFEIAKIYSARKNELPQEDYKLAISVNTDYSDLKGIIESLFRRLHIEQPLFSKASFDGFAPNIQALISDKKTKEVIGVIGKIDYASRQRMELKGDVFVSQLYLPYLVNNYKVVKRYIQEIEYSIVKLDTTITLKPGNSFAQLEYDVYQSSDLLRNIEYINSYNGKITLRLYFAHTDKNITEEEAKSELDKILKKIQ